MNDPDQELEIKWAKSRPSEGHEKSDGDFCDYSSGNGGPEDTSPSRSGSDSNLNDSSDKHSPPMSACLNVSFPIFPSSRKSIRSLFQETKRNDRSPELFEDCDSLNKQRKLQRKCVTFKTSHHSCKKRTVQNRKTDRSHLVSSASLYNGDWKLQSEFDENNYFEQSGQGLFSTSTSKDFETKENNFKSITVEKCTKFSCFSNTDSPQENTKESKKNLSSSGKKNQYKPKGTILNFGSRPFIENVWNNPVFEQEETIKLGSYGYFTCENVSDSNSLELNEENTSFGLSGSEEFSFTNSCDNLNFKNEDYGLIGTGRLWMFDEEQFLAKQSAKRNRFMKPFRTPFHSTFDN